MLRTGRVGALVSAATGSQERWTCSVFQSYRLWCWCIWRCVRSVMVCVLKYGSQMLLAGISHAACWRSMHRSCAAHNTEIECSVERIKWKVQSAVTRHVWLQELLLSALTYGGHPHTEGWSFLVALKAPSYVASRLALQDKQKYTFYLKRLHWLLVTCSFQFHVLNIPMLSLPLLLSLTILLILCFSVVVAQGNKHFFSWYRKVCIVFAVKRVCMLN